MIRRPPVYTLTYPLFPYSTLFRSRTPLDPGADRQRCCTSHRAGDGVYVAAAATIERRHRTAATRLGGRRPDRRSEEHTSELQSLMRISYAVLCLKKKINYSNPLHTHNHPSSAKHCAYPQQ